MVTKVAEPTIYIGGKLTKHPGWLQVYTPFDQEFVDRIKLLSSNDRIWNPDVKCWVVHPDYKSYVELTILNVYGVEPKYVDEPPFPGTSSGYNYWNESKPPPPPKQSSNGTKTSWVQTLYNECPPDARQTVLRALSRAFHPDVNPNGEERMKEITRVFKS